MELVAKKPSSPEGNNCRAIQRQSTNGIKSKEDGIYENAIIRRAEIVFKILNLEVSLDIID